MTWWTEDGHIVFPKPVIDLLVEATTGLRDDIMGEIELDDPELKVETGVDVFDNLEPKARIFALAHVLRHISEPDLPSPELYAWNEGTLWALCKRVEVDVEMELDMEGSALADDEFKYRVRRLILAALAAYGHSVKRYSYRSRNLSLWLGHLESICDNLFWDSDCLADEEFGDMDPARASALKQLLGIDPQYYVVPPPVVRDEDFQKADDYIRRVGGYP
jgi:hypothetical protein